MDCEKLISLVQERKYLWDQRETKYHMRNVQKQLWKEVSTEMKFSEDEVRKRWRGLRDTFRKEFMKHMKNKTDSGADACQLPSWPFFNQLSFLSATIKPRRMESCVLSIESDDRSMVKDEGRENEDLGKELADRGPADLHSTSQTSMSTSGSHWEYVDCHQQTPTTSSAKKLFKSPPKKKKCSKNEQLNFEEKLVELEPKKIKYSEQKTTRNQDGDYQFLISLLPYLHDIPRERKLFVRQKMMGVLIEEFQQQECATTTHSTANYHSDDSS